jgi:serine/threonine-protein kinase
VVGQRPEPGTFLAQGRSILIDVSSGPAPVGLPGVTGKSEADARAALEAAGFEVSATRRYDEQVPAGKVATQDPAPGQPAPPGSEVHLEMSDGPAPVVVPNVVGDSYDDASKALAAKGFTVRRTDEYSDSVEAGAVMRQNPVQGGEAPRGSAVTLVVSKGPDLVAVPEVRGQDVESAVSTLEQAGLQVDVVGFRFGRTVRDQDPPRGTKVHRGETVTLYMR